MPPRPWPRCAHELAPVAAPRGVARRVYSLRVRGACVCLSSGGVLTALLCVRECAVRCAAARLQGAYSLACGVLGCVV